MKKTYWALVVVILLGMLFTCPGAAQTTLEPQINGIPQFEKLVTDSTAELQGNVKEFLQQVENVSAHIKSQGEGNIPDAAKLLDKIVESAKSSLQLVDDRSEMMKQVNTLLETIKGEMANPVDKNGSRWKALHERLVNTRDDILLVRNNIDDTLNQIVIAKGDILRADFINQVEEAVNSLEGVKKSLQNLNGTLEKLQMVTKESSGTSGQ